MKIFILITKKIMIIMKIFIIKVKNLKNKILKKIIYYSLKILNIRNIY